MKPPEESRNGWNDPKIASPHTKRPTRSAELVLDPPELLTPEQEAELEAWMAALTPEEMEAGVEVPKEERLTLAQAQAEELSEANLTAEDVAYVYHMIILELREQIERAESRASSPEDLDPIQFLATCGPLMTHQQVAWVLDCGLPNVYKLVREEKLVVSGKRTRRSRILTESLWRHLGLPPKKHVTELN
jgi:hypothetical protein